MKSVYLDVNNTANTRRIPYSYIALPNQIEQISRSTKRTSSIQSENKKLDLILIPNPSSGIFKIQINGEYEANKVYQLKIIDCLGKTIESKRIVLSNNLQLDLSDVSNGIYLLIIFDNDKNISNSRISILK